MKKFKSLPLLVLCASMILSLAVHGGSKASDSDWKSLFNGKDLKGWTKLGGIAHYEVIDGAIVGTTVSDTPNTFLATDKLYSNFILEFEFNIDSAMNSGVQFRSNSKADYREGQVHGYQFELDPSPRAWTAGIYDEQRRGWLYPLELNPSVNKQIQGRTWYKARVECIDNEIRTFLDGKPAAHLIDSVDFTQTGFIALQVHSIKPEETPGKQIMWRNIQITENVNQYRTPTKPNIFVKDLRETQE